MIYHQEAMADAVKTLEVPFAAFDIESPWDAPAGISAVPLVLAESGGSPRLRTTVSAYRDRTNLYVLFSIEDERQYVATHLERDSPVYEEDALEVFLSPAELTLYFEFEVSPIATLFDARVDSPDLDRRTMKVSRDWNCDGFRAAVRRMTVRESSTADTVVIIPFEPLGIVSSAGTSIRANFFRIDRGGRDEYSAWSPTLRTPADFHVPQAFGRLLFV